jgi:hypothetical protein
MAILQLSGRVDGVAQACPGAPSLHVAEGDALQLQSDIRFWTSPRDLEDVLRRLLNDLSPRIIVFIKHGGTSQWIVQQLCEAFPEESAT